RRHACRRGRSPRAGARRSARAVARRTRREDRTGPLASCPRVHAGKGSPVTFREAVEARDLEAIEALLADDVVFRSPVSFRPYHGRMLTVAILREVAEVFREFRYVREIGDPAGRDHALVFEA